MVSSPCIQYKALVKRQHVQTHRRCHVQLLLGTDDLDHEFFGISANNHRRSWSHSHHQVRMTTTAAFIYWLVAQLTERFTLAALDREVFVHRRLQWRHSNLHAIQETGREHLEPAAVTKVIHQTMPCILELNCNALTCPVIAWGEAGGVWRWQQSYRSTGS